VRLVSRLSALPLLWAVLLLTACTGTDPGWTTVSAGQLTLERPTGWQEAASTDEAWPMRFVGDGMELRIAPQFSEDPLAAAAYDRLDLPARVGLSGYTSGGAKAFEVPGADTAIRSDFTYTENGAPRQGVWVIAGQYPYPRTSAVAVSGERLDDATVQHILGSLRYAKQQS
jgi:hypothetical protein